MTFRKIRYCVQITILLALAAAAAGLDDAPQTPLVPGKELPPVRLNGNVVETERHAITLGASGLPEQIAIRAAADELPLERRGDPENVPDTVLRGIGRGNQLDAPIRIEATVGGKTVAARPAEAAKPTVQDGTVVCKSKLAAGSVRIGLDLRYGRDGAIAAEMTYDPGGTGIDELALVVELTAGIDLVIPGRPVAAAVKAYDQKEFVLPDREGVVWGSAAADCKDGGRAMPGLVTRAFVGDGDRGFTWTAQKGAGWRIDKDASMMTLRRDKLGRTTWRVRFVNHPVKAPASVVKFGLRIHPAAFRAADRRRTAWFKDLVRDDPGAPRADEAGLQDGRAVLALLTGPAGGHAVSREQDLAETYPMPLFRFLAAAHTGMSGRLVTNATDLIRPGMVPAPDRVAIGRALLHDIGLDARGIAHRTDALRVVKALHEFGYFESDGKTEFIPYWRAKSPVRYGEEFQEDDAFELTTEDPTARVYASVYRRPAGTRGKAAKAMIVIVNESSKPLREQLYVLDPQRVFGGPNKHTEGRIVSRYDYSFAPPSSDWGKGPMMRRKAAGGPRDPIVLEDLEDHGFVRRPAARDGVEVYGPVYVPAHGMRILYGSGR